MSYFGSILRAKLEQHQLSLRAIEATVGMSASAISAICRGDQATVSKQNVENFLKLFSDPHDVAELCEAHLQDELPAEAKELLQISTLLPREKPAPYRVTTLDPTFENAVQRIRAAVPSNEDLRLCLIDLANACCPKPEISRTVVLHDPGDEPHQLSKKKKG